MFINILLAFVSFLTPIQLMTPFTMMPCSQVFHLCQQAKTKASLFIFSSNGERSLTYFACGLFLQDILSWLELPPRSRLPIVNTKTGTVTPTGTKQGQPGTLNGKNYNQGIKGIQLVQPGIKQRQRQNWVKN